MKYGRHNVESAGIVETPIVLEEDSGLSTMILRNQDNTVSRLSDNAAGDATNLRRIPCIPLMNSLQASSCRSAHIRDWKSESGRMRPAS